MENSTVQLVASLLDVDRWWTAHELAAEFWVSMSQNCAPHSALQTCSVLDTPWNFRGAAVAPLCNHTGLVGFVPKWSWRLSWTNHRYGRDLGLLMRTKLETPIKWMEASRFSSSKESVPYTMYCEGDVHCGIWHWWGNTAPHCTSKADGNATYYCMLLQHHLHENARSHTTAAVMDLLQCDILEHPLYLPDMSPCDYDCQSARTTTRDPVQKMNLSVL